jgi:hypothetical protein
MSATSLEINQVRERSLDKDGESAENDEIIHVSAFFVRTQDMKPTADHSPTIYSNSY